MKSSMIPEIPDRHQVLDIRSSVSTRLPAARLRYLLSAFCDHETSHESWNSRNKTYEKE